MKLKKIAAAFLAAATCITSFSLHNLRYDTVTLKAEASDISELPNNYKSAAEWIWETRIQGEKSVEAWDTIYDKIVAGNGTLNYVVRWQTYEKISLAQRQNLQKVLEQAVNDWTDRLVGYENWPYSHVNVKIVGWAVLDKSCLQDLQPNETVYTNTVPYDPSYDIKNKMGDDRMLNVMPVAPDDLFRYLHWEDPSWSYNGSYENRYDMQLTASLGMIDMGGYGYYWGQQLSDNAVLGLANGTTSVHILEHEVGHGFGFTDFYGGEGASDGFPPGGFPDNGTSIMMAGSSTVITDFDGWFARYVWTKISAEEGRFDLENAQPVITTASAEFSDTITYNESGNISFAKNGSYTYSGTDYYGGDDNKNLAHYEKGDKITIIFTYNKDTSEILNVEYLKLDENVNTTPTTTTTITTATTTKATTTTTKSTTTTSKAATTTSTKQTTTSVTTTKASSVNTASAEFSDTITYNEIGNISFAKNGSYTYSGTDYYGGDDKKILDYYEIGDIISIKFIYNKDTSEIISIEHLKLEENIRNVKGDVNDDGVFSITDIVIMQKWLLAVPDTTLADWKAGDLLEDGKLNVFDLCLMKRMLIKQ